MTGTGLSLLFWYLTELSGADELALRIPNVERGEIQVRSLRECLTHDLGDDQYNIFKLVWQCPRAVCTFAGWDCTIFNLDGAGVLIDFFKPYRPFGWPIDDLDPFLVESNCMGSQIPDLLHNCNLLL